jgi:hypothetical protein
MRPASSFNCLSDGPPRGPHATAATGWQHHTLRNCHLRSSHKKLDLPVEASGIREVISEVVVENRAVLAAGFVLRHVGVLELGWLVAEVMSAIERARRRPTPWRNCS